MNASRPVPYNPHGHEVMAAAAEVATSLDVDRSFRLLPFQLQVTPPRRSGASPEMLRRSSECGGCGPCGSGGSWSRVRTPIGRVGSTGTVGVKAMAAEVADLEWEVGLLRRQIALRDRVVHGLCGLISEKR